MRNGRRLPLSPGTAIALVALFFALGGSAFAIGGHVQGSSALQKRCANGAVRGVATVTGDPKVGIANLSDQFTGAAAVFARRFNCTGRSVQVRRVAAGVFEVRFTGNGAATGLASPLGGGAAAAVETVSGGTFRVSIYGAGSGDLADLAFSIVAV